MCTQRPINISSLVRDYLLHSSTVSQAGIIIKFQYLIYKNNNKNLLFNQVPLDSTKSGRGGLKLEANRYA